MGVIIDRKIEEGMTVIFKQKIIGHFPNANASVSCEASYGGLRGRFIIHRAFMPIHRENLLREFGEGFDHHIHERRDRAVIARKLDGRF